jgi:hypothetical protein
LIVVLSTALIPYLSQAVPTGVEEEVVLEVSQHFQNVTILIVDGKIRF